MSTNLNSQRRKAGLVYALLVAISVFELIQAGGASFAVSLQNRAAAGFVWRTVAAHPGAFLPVAAQLLVIAAMHALFFWLIWKLGNTKVAEGRWFERPTGSVAITWASACWLLLDTHNDRFVQSVWNYRFWPITDAPASNLLSAAAAAWLLLRLYRVFKRCSRPVRRTLVSFGALAAIPFVAAALSYLPRNLLKSDNASGARNVVLIGLDSMRRDLAVSDKGAELLPHLTAVRQAAFAEANVVTPLSHTFPSWTTILTGLHPRDSGARYNLTARDQVDTRNSLASLLKARGYRTIYATDETRFSNIGENFGFDEVISPQAGVPDFLLAQYVDQPLVNLAVQIPYMELLLPALTGNRGFAHAYDPERFLDRLETAIGTSDGRPTFVAVHLCLAHWPFYSQQATATADGFPPSPYYPAAAQVDAQFASLRARLKRLGYLNPEALEVILADHGESTHPEENIPAELQLHGGLNEPPKAPRGHGVSLLSPAQWQIFTLYSGMGETGRIPAGRSDQLASLEDVAPTIIELMGLPSIGTGKPMSVVDAVAHRMPTGGRNTVSMETGYTPRGFDTVNPDGDAAIRIAESGFDVQDDGRVEMKRAVYAATLPLKQIGITDGRRSLVVTGEMTDSVLVSHDLGEQRWDVYPATTGTVIGEVPLLAEACSDAEFRARIPSWCTSRK